MNTKVSKRSLLSIAIVATLAVLAVIPASASGFERGVVVLIEDGKEYYFAGEPVGDGWDIPGHSWVQAGPDQWVGKHVNTGPGGASKWWSSDAPDGELLYMVHGIVDGWSETKAEEYAALGYVHRHELVTAGPDGKPVEHPNKVIWFKHIARTSFTLNGGPGGQGQDPPYLHFVTPGVDLAFPNNYAVNPWPPQP